MILVISGLIYLTAVADIGPRPGLELNNEPSSTHATRKLNCVAETRALIKELGERFGHNAVPQTCSLILAALSRSEAPIFNDPGHISLQPPIDDSHSLELQTTSENYSSSLQESTRRDTGTKSDPLEKPADDGAVSQFDGELQQHSSLADGNSVFNDFFAIDTSEW